MGFTKGGKIASDWWRDGLPGFLHGIADTLSLTFLIGVRGERWRIRKARTIGNNIHRSGLAGFRE